MRARPVRRNIYLPVVRFGVADSDWFSVLLISCSGYLVPVAFGFTLLYVPLQMWTWLLATAGSIAFFNYIRIGRKPHWLQHKLKSVFSKHRQYRALPNGRRRPFERPWLIDATDNEPPSDFQRSPSAKTMAQTALLLEENDRIWEACEKRWNNFSVTMS